MMNEFSTIETLKEIKIEVKKSIFIANIQAVSSEVEAKKFVSDICVKYNDARHNVPVYRVLSEDNRLIESYSDNGEPKGTAGMPILEILRGRGLVNICLIVTRYFGGILLGTGGLVHAYSDAAKEVIIQSKIISKKLADHYELICDYNDFEKIRYMLEKNTIFIGDIIYLDKVKLNIYLQKNMHQEHLLKMLFTEVNGNLKVKLLLENIYI